MAFRILDAATATGASNSQTFTKLIKDHTIQVSITGAPTAVEIDLEGSLDNISFFTLGQMVFDAGDLTALGAMLHVPSSVVRFVRVNLTTLTGGSSPTVTALYEGFENRS